jgi:lactate dehydrogenase-like 2-hydroxyacid dehydrogenase
MTKPKTLIVTIAGMIGEQDLAPLREKSDVDYCELTSITESDLAKKCAGYNYLMLNMDVVPKTKDSSVKLSDTFYADPSVRALKTIAIDMTGMDYFSPKAAAAAGVMLQNIPHYSSQSVAETILSEILLHSRQRHAAYVDLLKGGKAQARKGINLANRTAGIVGYGSIGSTVAGILKGIGMNVIVWNRSPKVGVKCVSLTELFQQSDVICVTLKTVNDGVDSNTGLIGADLLKLCRNAIIVNLANELLVDSDAITVALRNGNVAAYSVEASGEILRRQINEGNPDAEKVHFAPSNAWNSDESMQTLRDVWVNNILSVIAGKPINVYRE